MRVEFPNVAVAQPAQVIRLCEWALPHEQVNNPFGFTVGRVPEIWVILTDEAFGAALGNVNIADVFKPEQLTPLLEFEPKVHRRVF